MTDDNVGNYDTRRHFTRVSFEGPARLIAADRQVDCQLLDISLKGALLSVPESVELSVGDPYTLEMFLGAGEIVIRMEARVAHVHAGRAGFRCDRIDMESIVHLRRLLELNMGDSELLKREVSALGKQ